MSTSNPPRKRHRRGLLYLLLTLPALLVVLVAALAFTAGESDFKRGLVWLAATFMDSRLEIAGPLRLEMDHGMRIAAGDVTLQADDGTYSLQLHKLDMRFRLLSVFSGALQIHELTLANLSLDISEAAGDEAGETFAFSLPPVLIERTQVTNLDVRYRERAPGTVHDYSVDELILGAATEGGRITLRASGSLDGRHVEVSGSLPPLAGMLAPGEPREVALQLSGDNISAAVNGTISDFVSGKGLDLGLELQARDVQDILEAFGDGVPRVGDLDAKARLRGDYDAAALDEIAVRLHREPEVEITVTGKIADIQAGKGVDLRFSGQSDRPTVASWLLFGKLDRIAAIKLDAGVQEHYGRWQLSNVHAEASSSDGLELAASGSAELYGSGHVFSGSDQGLSLAFSAPTTAAANLSGIEGIPELGAVSGTARLLVSRDALGIHDAEVRIGKGRGRESVVRGSVAHIGLLEKGAVSGINLQASLQFPDVAALAKQLGHDLPALGRAQADVRAYGNLDDLRLSKISATLDDSNGLHVTAQGNTASFDLAAMALPADADFKVTASVPRLADLSRLVDAELPALGLTRLSGDLKIRGNRLQLDPVSVNIGPADQPVIRLNGKATTILRKGSSIDVAFEVAVTDLLMAFTEMKPGYLGRLQGRTSVADMDGSWGIEQLKLVSSGTSLYQLEVGGGYADARKTDQASVTAKLSVPNPAALGRALNLDFSGVGAWDLGGEVTRKGDSISYNGRGKYGKTNVSTVIEGHLREGKPQLTGRTKIPVLHLEDFGFGHSVEASAGAVPRDKPQRSRLFSRKPVDIGFLNALNLDLDLQIDRVESDKQLTISSVVGHTRVRDGRLTVAPLRLIFEGGTMDISFTADARAVPDYRLTATANDLVLGPLMSQVQNDVPITGYTNINLELNASGRSPHDLAASLGGSLSYGLENAKIPSKYIELLSVDLLGWVVSSTIKRKPYTDLNCVVMAFDVDNGVMTSKVLVADGPSLSVGGNITLDLGAETIKAVLIPKQKRTIFSSITPVKIHGPIMDPKVEAVPVKAAIQEVGAMVLLPTLVIPARVLQKLWSLMDKNDKTGGGCGSLESVIEAAQKQIKE